MANPVARDLKVVPVQPSATPEPVQAQWTCALSKLDETGTPVGDLAEPITVGTLFHAACAGAPTELKADSLILEVAADARYAFRVLEVRDLKPERVELVATSWTPGEVSLQNLVLTDGSQRVALAGVELSVESVIEKPANPEELKPMPPWAPITLGWPVYVWGILLALILMAVLSALLAYRESHRRRKLKKLLEQNAIVLSPYNHFNKELRRINRTLPVKSEAWNLEDAKIYFNELNVALRWLVARELFVSAIGSKPRSILRDIKKADKNLYAKIKKDLYLALTELQKTMEAKSTPSLEDANQIAELCRQIANTLGQSSEEQRKAERKKN